MKVYIQLRLLWDIVGWTLQWFPRERECTWWRGVLPQRCLAPPSPWSTMAHFISAHNEDHERWSDKTMIMCWWSELTLNCLSKVILMLGMQLCSIMAANAYTPTASEAASLISFMFVSRIPWKWRFWLQFAWNWMLCTWIFWIVSSEKSISGQRASNT